VYSTHFPLQHPSTGPLSQGEDDENVWLCSKSDFPFVSLPCHDLHMRMSRTLRLKVPKPRSWLGCIDLQTASEVITIFTLINKVSGFYGILSLFTGTSECTAATSDT
jgi:hypothetical protein